ncbi:MAG: efflux RND transporter periplasmic adaptor subunit [Bryobacterales bacterium]|nr:efflux RND transporter periplasmic adaptor subunit [Bryobacterales bacterium]
MTRNWKIVLGVLGVAVVGGAIYGGIKYREGKAEKVQTARVARQDVVSLVTATGEIRPLNYINIGANAQGRITEILVQEGDRVAKGQILAKLEAVQPQSQLASQEANYRIAEADAAGQEAAVRAAADSMESAEAAIARAQAQAEQARIDFDRAKELSEAKLIARQEFDTRKSAYEVALASVKEAEAAYARSQAQQRQAAAALNSAQRRITAAKAEVTRVRDLVERTYAISPLAGMVTNLPVKVGEIVVPGIQNSAASLIMTIADMSVITAEVKVDETDIVNVKLGQTADVTIEAIPDKTFKGKVIEIGNTAILRSSGLASSQSQISSDEAKDFKVVVALDSPPDEIRPGLSSTVKILTNKKADVLALPIQALTVRTKGDLEKKDDKKDDSPPADAKLAAELKKEMQGVFVVDKGSAKFREVKTGITGTTEVEVLSGLKAGDEVITGPYRSLRTIRNETKIEVDNKRPGTGAEGNS